jgi:methylglutaconyl-CoA hydratase
MQEKKSIGSVLTTIENKIATIEFAHPQSNSLPADLLNLLATEFNLLSANPDVLVIILKSSGTGAFCAGASFDELLTIENQGDASQFFSGFANVLNAMRTCSKIVLGRIHSKTVGGGLGLIAACDYAFSTSESAIKLSELAIGIGPFVIEPAITRKIGIGAMTELTLETNWKSALWSKEKGLFAKTCNSITDLDFEISAFANKLATYNPEALSEMKKACWQGTEHWSTLLYERAEISGKLVLSDFSRNALNEFKK